MKKLLFIFILISNLVSSRTYYVSNSGSNLNEGTMDRPWSTILFAIESMKPADTVMLREGVYNENEIWIRASYKMGGLPGMHKTIMSFPDERAIYRGARGFIISASYIRIIGINFQNDMAINLGQSEDSCSHNEIINCTFLGSYIYGAISMSSHFTLIQGNKIEIIDNGHLNTQDHGIYILRGSNNVLRNNIISNSIGYGIHIYDEKKSYDPPGLTEKTIEQILIEGNEISSSKQRSGIILACGPICKIREITIRNNLIYNNNHIGIVSNSVDISSIHNIKIYNNTIYGHLQSIHLNAGSNLEITHNILDEREDHCMNNCGWYEKKHLVISTSIKEARVNTNLYFPQQYLIEGAIDSFSIQGDPLFEDIKNNNFMLQHKSPAINVYSCKHEVDKLNVSRPQEMLCDLGAYEKQIINTTNKLSSSNLQYYLCYNNIIIKSLKEDILSIHMCDLRGNKFNLEFSKLSDNSIKIKLPDQRFHQLYFINLIGQESISNIKIFY